MALIFHTGTIKTSGLKDYKKKSELFSFNFFRSYMGRNQFMLILRALHFSYSKSSNRLNKIENIVSYFNKKMDEVYEPCENLDCVQKSIYSSKKLLKNKKNVYLRKRSNLCYTKGKKESLLYFTLLHVMVY